jgi:serine/threonine protein kinase
VALHPLEYSCPDLLRIAARCRTTRRVKSLRPHPIRRGGSASFSQWIGHGHTTCLVAGVNHAAAYHTNDLPTPASHERASLKRGSAPELEVHSGAGVSPDDEGSRLGSPSNPRPYGASLLCKGELFAERYRIDGILGNGGMGVVYSATHLELDLPVAIKLIHPDLVDSQEARARFQTEALAGALLSSPHTVRVYDAGGLGTNGCFVVMEQLRGLTLEALVRSQGPLPVGTAVDYVVQAALGLAEAHEQGLVHRDIKPENLFLVQSPGVPPLIKVIDFGIARWHAGSPDHVRLTNPKTSLGSPCYQSPEQMEKSLEVDLRSDIWSLGLVLFELLTGSCPFESDSIQETCWKVLKGPRPSLLAARPGIDPGLARVVDLCLRLDPARRWSSMNQLCKALSPYASPGGSPLRVRKSSATPTLPTMLEPPPSTRTAQPRRMDWLPVATFALGALMAVGMQTPEPEWSLWAEWIRDTSGETLAHVWSGANTAWAHVWSGANTTWAHVWSGANATWTEVAAHAERLAAPATTP